ncbi:hypothetical protein AAFF_G00285430 [Aldrovandia affinis]|uniref:Uncharacterized protein n=1 Tax=Aldrovandia affinis TaxID=143900 RepID=A0AAD7TAD2_9TELE|nr:hypothetical protein AAFF_G00285430 [Aldrovandia affinis]
MGMEWLVWCMLGRKPCQPGRAGSQQTATIAPLLQPNLTLRERERERASQCSRLALLLGRGARAARACVYVPSLSVLEHHASVQFLRVPAISPPQLLATELEPDMVKRREAWDKLGQGLNIHASRLAPVQP